MDAAVEEAEKLQQSRATTQATVLSQEISTAPAVELTSGDGDVSTTGVRICHGVGPSEHDAGLCSGHAACVHTPP